MRKNITQMKKASTGRDIVIFLKKPNFKKLQGLSIKTKIWILFKVLILTYIGVIVAGLPFEILKGLNVIGEVSSNVNMAIETITKKNIDYKPYFILSSIVLVPLLEETAFRLFLTKYRINFVIVSVSVMLGALIIHFINTILWRPDSYLLFSLSIYIYVLIISVIIGFGLWLLRNYLKGAQNLWNDYFGLIFYSVAIIFALFHVMSVNSNENSLIYTPVVLLPFFIYGLSFGYVRIRLGFVYSLALHFIILSIRFGLPELINVLKV